MDCVFCKMAAGEIPVEPVYENDLVMVIRDINPQAPTHLLVVPKLHYRSLLDCEDPALPGEMLKAAALVATRDGFAEKGFRTVVNTNPDGGQTVWHLHMHVLAGRPLAGRLG